MSQYQSYSQRTQGTASNQGGQSRGPANVTGQVTTSNITNIPTYIFILF